MTAQRAADSWIDGLTAMQEETTPRVPQDAPTLIRMPGSVEGAPATGDHVQQRVRAQTPPLVLKDVLTRRAYEIVATNLTGGYLRLAEGSPPPSPARTLCLDGANPLGGTMRVWMRPLARSPWDLENIVRFRWTAVGAGAEPAQLCALVAHLIGVEIPLAAGSHAAAEGRMWVYDAERMTLRHISRRSWVGSEPALRPTAPEMSATVEGYEPDIAVIPRGSEAAVPISMVPREGRPGTFALQGLRRGMICGWLSETHLAFAVPTDAAPPLDAILDVAVPADPVWPRAIWVTGQVCRQKPLADDKTLVQVDLRRFGPLVPESYRRLVQHWRQARAKRTPGTSGR